MWMIIGLGNPGIRYKWSRHNIGFQVIDLIAKNYCIKLKKNRFVTAITGRGKIGDEEVILVKPVTYMNNSGNAISGVKRLYEIPVSKILVVLDDIDLSWGKVRIRAKGSSGGHKGLQSIVNVLNDSNFPRLRMGIGRGRVNGAPVTKHVLDRFNKEEKEQLPVYYEKALSAIDTVLGSGVEVAMNRFN